MHLSENDYKRVAFDAHIIDKSSRGMDRTSENGEITTFPAEILHLHEVEEKRFTCTIYYSPENRSSLKDLHEMLPLAMWISFWILGDLSERSGYFQQISIGFVRETDEPVPDEHREIDRDVNRALRNDS